MKKMLVIILSAMWILDVKAMKAQNMLIVHCCKQHEKNTSDGFEVNVFFPLLHLTCGRANFYKLIFTV
jgi:hypothetical protein